MIGTFPIVKPQHGGQLRNRAIYDYYVSKGHDVRYVGVSIRGWYPEVGQDDIIISDPPAGQTFTLNPEMEMGSLLYNDAKLKKQLVNILKEFSPDIIQFEQPYVYVGVSKILDEQRWDGSIVYSSHNIEADLKREMLLSGEFVSASLKQRQKIVNDIEKNEKDLSVRANLTISCTDSDAVKLNELGAKNCIVVPNSAMKNEIRIDNLNSWKSRLHNERISKIILFIGSAHPPNMNGFKGLVGYRLGYLPRDTRIFIVGGVCDLLADDLGNEMAHVATTFRLRATMLGRVEDDDLASLLYLADTIILPITQGGGSNLKTAEAILADRKIVATTASFRSFESFLSGKNIRIADTREAFKQALLESVSAPKYADTRFKENSRKLTWGHALKGLSDRMSEI